jgi:hypothetical protein
MSASVEDGSAAYGAKPEPSRTRQEPEYDDSGSDTGTTHVPVSIRKGNR